MSINLSNLTKTFGEQKAVNNISFVIPSGQVVGFLGPNGAGKSTTMKMITGYLPQTSGNIEVCGLNTAANSLDIKRKIGYLPESNPLYKEMYVQEYLHYVGKVYRLDQIQKKVQEMILLTGLTREKDKKIFQLSKGYKQRVGIAQAMIHDPEVLILDEPTSGLDPNQLDDIRSLILKVGQEKTVMLSTHIMQEVEAMCERVIIINQGQIVADNSTANLKKQNKKQQIIHVEFLEEINSNLLSNLSSISEVKILTPKKISLYVKPNVVDMRPELFQLAVENKWTIVNLSQEEQDLEAVFKELTKGSTE